MKSANTALMKVGQNTTKRVFCTCEHEYQDERYGKQKRIANLAPKAKGFRCTVCLKIHD